MRGLQANLRISSGLKMHSKDAPPSPYSMALICCRFFEMSSFAYDKVGQSKKFPHPPNQWQGSSSIEYFSAPSVESLPLGRLFLVLGLHPSVLAPDLAVCEALS